mmetsp:Transcript_21430/g.48529  ORF Transcript_21430/g.48529 Transcript_21430/m.48529 type:complete len:95 (+) Transcript_21430:111-395(+)|eukprot:768441-Hanusia_phi.AAC.7
MSADQNEMQVAAEGSTTANLSLEQDMSGKSAKGDVQVAKSVMESCLKQGLVELCKEKPSDPVRWLAHWLLENNPNQPKVIPPVTAVGSENSYSR